MNMVRAPHIERIIVEEGIADRIRTVVRKIAEREPSRVKNHEQTIINAKREPRIERENRR